MLQLSLLARENSACEICKDSSYCETLYQMESSQLSTVLEFFCTRSAALDKCLMLYQLSLRYLHVVPLASLCYFLKMIFIDWNPLQASDEAVSNLSKMQDTFAYCIARMEVHTFSPLECYAQRYTSLNGLSDTL